MFYSHSSDISLRYTPFALEFAGALAYRTTDLEAENHTVPQHREALGLGGHSEAGRRIGVDDPANDLPPHDPLAAHEYGLGGHPVPDRPPPLRVLAKLPSLFAALNRVEVFLAHHEEDLFHDFASFLNLAIRWAMRSGFNFA